MNNPFPTRRSSYLPRGHEALLGEESKLASVPGCSELSHCATIYRLAGPPLLEARPRPGLTPCWAPGHRTSSNRQHQDLRRSYRLGAPSEGGALLQASFVGFARRNLTEKIGRAHVGTPVHN